jgi:tetratricopeptide (TPR) repeat protein
MPKIIKKKPAKKKPVQDTEEVKTVALHALDVMKGRQKQAIIIVSAIVAIVLIFVFFNFYTYSQNKKAHELEMEANSIYFPAKTDKSMPETEKWKRAMELYKKAVDVKATPTALFSLGNCYYNLGDYENAIKQYNLFIEKFSGDYVILPLVYQKLASAYLKTGKNEKALETFASLSKIKNGTFKDTALLMEARHYEILGNTAKAQEKYRALVSEFPNSPWSAEATAKVSQKAKTEDKATTGQTPHAVEPVKK